MKKIGLFCAKSADKTSRIAEQIREKLGEQQVEIVAVEDAWKKEFRAYDHLIVGVSTWFDGELPTYWDELVPELESLDLKGKKIALYGLGDQKNYPENFQDGMGILASAFEKAGATLVGFTSTQGYAFHHSKALRKGGQWCGLALDLENQAELTPSRIEKWCAQLKREF